MIKRRAKERWGKRERKIVQSAGALLMDWVVLSQP